MSTFRDLNIIEPMLELLDKENITTPTEIQAKSIPLIAQGKDVIAGSATGSGKTIAFAAGIIANCEKGHGIQALIMTPTRELAEQVSKVVRKFSKFKKLSVVEVFGGVGINPQIMNLRKADIVVGTPGRLLDHIGRKTIDFSGVEVLIIDEADRMFDMGFIEDVEKIINKCPKKRQNLLFSATINEGVVKLSKKYLNNAVKVSADNYVDPKKLKQIYYNIADNLKFSLLVHLLKQERSGLVMVFCNSRKTVDFVEKNLKLQGIEAHSLHGGYSQAKRSKVIDDFHSNKAHILVCTDVAARGLDIKGVSHVYNYDIPKDSKEYVHRIGRTARAGKDGIAVNLLATRDYGNFDKVLGDNDVDIEKADPPVVPKVHVKMANSPREYGSGRPQRGRGSGGRSGGRQGGRQGGRPGGRQGGRQGGNPRGRSEDRQGGNPRGRQGGRPGKRNFSRR